MWQHVCANYAHWMVGQIDASIVAAILLAIAVACRHRLSPHVRSALLLIALVRLALPPWLRSPWSEALVDLPPIDDTRMLAVEWLSPLTPVLFTATMAISLGLLMRLAWHARAMSRRLQSLAPAPARLRQRVHQLAGHRHIDVRVSPTEAPFASGVFRKVIVLPAPLAEGLDPVALDAVLAHEVAHHERRDLWWLMAAALLTSVAWFNPLAHLVWRALVAAREDGSDDWAVTRTARDPFTYAHALLQSASLIAAPQPLGTAGAHPMGRRLQRLLDGRADRTSRLTLAGAALVLLAAACALPGAHMPALDDPAGRDDAVIVIQRVLGERGLDVIRNR